MLLPKFMGAEESPGTTEVPQGFSINAVALPRVCDSACIGNITSEMVFFFCILLMLSYFTVTSKPSTGQMVPETIPDKRPGTISTGFSTAVKEVAQCHTG